MADDLTVRDPYGNTFAIDPSARPFWEHREGYEIVPAPDPAPEPAAAAAPVEPTPPKPSTKAAVRPASNDKE